MQSRTSRNWPTGSVPLQQRCVRVMGRLWNGPVLCAGFASGRSALKPIGKEAHMLSFRARCAMDEVGNTLNRCIRQRCREFLFYKACSEQIFGGDDRTQPISNRVHGDKQVVEPVTSFHQLMIYVHKIEPCLPLARAG
jgi:hypothetical protein